MPDELHDQADGPLTHEKRRRWTVHLPPVWVLTLSAVLFVIVAVVLPLWIPWCQRAAVLRDIKSLGGGVVLHENGPAWIRQWCGIVGPSYSGRGPANIGPFNEIMEVNLSRGNRQSRTPREITPQLIERLSVFPTLASLDLSYSTVTDDWMPQISRLSSLEELDLSHCRVSGRGFACLSRMPGLEHIDLTYCPMGDAHLDHLAKIPSLKYVGLVYCSRLTTASVDRFMTSRPDLQVNLYGLRRIQLDLNGLGYTLSATGMKPPGP